MNSLIYLSVKILFNIIYYLVLIRILLSWIPMNRDNFIIRLIYGLTEPLLKPIRDILKKSALGESMFVDFSPIVLFLILQIIQSILFNILF